MARRVDVEARPDPRPWLGHDDGAEGEVDLSHLAGRRVGLACPRLRSSGPPGRIPFTGVLEGSRG